MKTNQFFSTTAGVVSRMDAEGCVWSCRSARAGRVFPVALCVPFDCLEEAEEWARELQLALMKYNLHNAIIYRYAKRCISDFEVKIVFNNGITAEQAKYFINQILERS